MVSAKAVEKSFMGEGQRIIKALSSMGKESPPGVHGEFPLPAHRTIDELGLSSRNELGLSSRKKADLTHKTITEIKAVGETIEKMEKNLPPEWVSMWALRKRDLS
jgi:hypothetical protein